MTTCHSDAEMKALERAYARKRALYEKARIEMVDALNALGAARARTRNTLRKTPEVSDLGNRVAT